MPRDRRAYYLANKEKIDARNKAWAETNREKRKAYEQSYYLANKDKYAKRSKKWVEDNRDRANELGRKSRAKHPETKAAYRLATRDKRIAWQKAYDAEHRDKEKAREAQRKWSAKNGKEYKARWRAENTGKTAFYTARRRSRKRYATPAWLTDNDWNKIDCFYVEAAKSGMDVDHIVPIQGKTVCGLHVPWNLQLLTKTENKMKSNRLPADHEHFALSV